MPLNPIVRASDHPYFLSRVSNARCGPVEHGGLAGNTGGRWRSELERVLLLLLLLPWRGMKKGLPPPVFNSFRTFCHLLSLSVNRERDRRLEISSQSCILCLRLRIIDNLLILKRQIYTFVLEKNNKRGKLISRRLWKINT